jgi:hypothetical protein
MPNFTLLPAGQMPDDQIVVTFTGESREQATATVYLPAHEKLPASYEARDTVEEALSLACEYAQEFDYQVVFVSTDRVELWDPAWGILEA